VATQRIEDLIQKLEENYTIVIVTHNMQQAARVSEECGFMLLGELVEFGDTSKVFTAPDDPRTEDYVTGRYG
jgi:phosphate transport system ATP-binding protein